MKDIAIQFIKTDLGGGRHIFKPNNVIEGFYDSKDDSFTTEYGVVCESITGWNNEAANFFGCRTTINDLKKSFKDKNSKESLLREYFRIYSEYYYIGYYDFMDSRIVTKKIHFDEIDNPSKEISVISNKNSSDKVTFDFNSLMDLRNSNSLKEVRSKIDTIVDLVYDTSDKRQIESNPDESKSDVRIDLDLNNITPYTILSIEEKEYSKEELMKIIECRINHLKGLYMDSKQLQKEIDCILDAYNEIIFAKQKKKTL